VGPDDEVVLAEDDSSAGDDGTIDMSMAETILVIHPQTQLYIVLYETKNEIKDMTNNATHCKNILLYSQF